ncbi:unnamed protein product [Parajaminaea phylloscopi]
MLLGNAIVWQSRLQPVIASATTDAEYIALSDGARELISVVNLLTDLFGHDIVAKPYVIYCDNNNAIITSESISNHSRVRHIDIHYHKIQEWRERGIISVVRCDTRDNVADAMTKPLRAPSIETFRQSVKLLPLPNI